MDLYSSKWAPKSSYAGPGKNSKAGKAVSMMDELQGSKRLFKRLQWKSSLLLISYQQAMANTAATKDTDLDDAKIMFKIDFFEFYVLLERLLAQLLELFRVPVSQNPHRQDPDRIIIGSSKGPRPFLQHRFHAEILESFDQPDNPLHDILGVDPVRAQLQNAKDFRNKWKDAESTGEAVPINANAAEIQPSSRQSPKDRRVEELDLTNMLQSIDTALGLALALAEKHVLESTISVDDQPHASQNMPSWLSYESMECDDEDHPYEAIPDGMDWQYA